MKKKSLVAVLLCSALVGGCLASEGDVGFLYTRQKDLETNLKKAEKDIEWLKAEASKEDETPVLKEKIFELENKTFELEQLIGSTYAGMRSTESSFEKTEKDIKQLRTQFARKKDTVAIKKKTTQLAKKVAVLEKRLAASTADMNKKIVEMKKTLSELSTPSPEKSESDYDLGRKKLEGGDYEAARKLLRRHVAAAPKASTAADASFLIAEAYFGQKLYEEAILEYQNLIDSYPKSPKIPASQLKQGLALLKIKKPAEAELFLKSLIKAHPKSPEAAEAKKVLDKIRSPKASR